MEGEPKSESYSGSSPRANASTGSGLEMIAWAMRFARGMTPP